MFRRIWPVAAAGGSLALLAALTLVLPGCRSKDDDVWPKDHAGPKVVVSFAPLYCFAVNVAGDDAVVRTVMTTAGPHHFNPTDQDAKLLRRADLLFINGLGLDDEQAETLRRGSGNEKLRVIDLGSRIPQNLLLKGGEHDHGDGDHHHHDGGHDPHVWLSPEYAILFVEAIRDELKAADPAHAANYDRRAAEYVAKLRKLQADGVAMLKDKKDRKLVTFHESMSYFAKAFDLNIVGVVQKKPGSEPSGRALTQLIGLCSDPDHPVRVITAEPQYSNSHAGTQLIKELARKNVPDPVLVEIDPLETCPAEALKNPDWYETKMRQNLENLAGAMR